MVEPPVHWLFSYGTLRQPEVQMALFGRRLVERADSLVGFRIDRIVIATPDVVAVSGAAVHRILRRDADATDPVRGAALALDARDLAVADEYEGDNYVRVTARLGSGLDAFVYIAPDIA